jgi:hypothetical protein
MATERRTSRLQRCAVSAAGVITALAIAGPIVEASAAGPVVEASAAAPLATPLVAPSPTVGAQPYRHWTGYQPRPPHGRTVGVAWRRQRPWPPLGRH